MRNHYAACAACRAPPDCLRWSRNRPGTKLHPARDRAPIDSKAASPPKEAFILTLSRGLLPRAGGEITRHSDGSLGDLRNLGQHPTPLPLPRSLLAALVGMTAKCQRS